MSLLVLELGQVFNRIAIVAPTKKQLLSFFEDQSLEVTTELMGPNEKSQFVGCALPGGSLAAFAAFSLGERSKLNMRVTLCGFALDQGPIPLLALEHFEGLIFFVPDNSSHLEQLLALHPSQSLASKPLVVVGLNEINNGPKHDLRSQALQNWFERRFSKVKALAPGPSILKESLDWVLSF